jgi:hypothetical protein
LPPNQHPNRNPPQNTTTPQTPKNTPIIQIPQTIPTNKESFDGFIFAEALPREEALDRMLKLIELDTPAKYTIGWSRYELFKHAENIIFQEWNKHKNSKNVWDDWVQRFAFAAAMEVPEYRTIQYLKFALEKYRNEYMENNHKIYIWLPASQILRDVYFNNQWGWDGRYKRTEQTWAYELNRKDSPRLEYFPAKRYELEQQQKKLQKKQHTPNPPHTPITTQKNN